MFPRPFRQVLVSEANSGETPDALVGAGLAPVPEGCLGGGPGELFAGLIDLGAGSDIGDRVAAHEGPGGGSAPRLRLVPVRRCGR